MAIVRVQEIGSQRAGSFGPNGEANYTRVFQVLTDNKKDGPQTAMLATDPVTGVTIPQAGDIYIAGNDKDLGAFCTGPKASQADDRNALVWLVTCEYTTTTNQTVSNPLARPTEISFGFAQFQRAAIQDINGNAIRNTAKDFFDPPVEIDDARPVVTMVKNLQTFNRILAHDFQNAVNNAQFYGYPTRSVKVANIGAVEQQENGIKFIRATFEFHIRRDLWIPLKVLNAGMKDAAGNTIRGGTQVSSPEPLDASGNFLAIGSTAFTFVDVTAYKELDFGLLGVP